MLRFFISFFLFLTVSLFAEGSGTLHHANKLVNSSKKSDIFRAYNDYKNLYLEALMNNDESLRLGALKGIVKSANKLHIDVENYEKELARVKKYIPKKKPLLKEKKYYTPIKNTPKKDLHVSSIKLHAIHWKSSKLLCSFTKVLRHNQVNYFSLYDRKLKKYKYVFDIHASMASKPQKLYKKGVDSIELLQYKPDTLRLIILNHTKLKVHFSLQVKQLIISMQQSKKVKKYNTLYNPKKTIVIDAGHGGKDPGAIGYKHYREKVVVLHIAKDLQKILKQRGYKVYMTRSGDYFIKLRNRTKFANRKKADLFISIHANAVGKRRASKAEGVECYFLDKSRSSRAKKVAAQENLADMTEMDYYGKELFLSTLNSHNIVASNKLAIDLQRGVLARLRKSYRNVKDSGVRPAPFWVLVGAQMPAVLVEVGFITHPKEAKRLVSKSYQQKMAEGLANGIERYFINN